MSTQVQQLERMQAIAGQNIAIYFMNPMYDMLFTRRAAAQKWLEANEHQRELIENVLDYCEDQIKKVIALKP